MRLNYFEQAILCGVFWLSLGTIALGDEVGFRFLAKVIDAPKMADPATSPYPDMLSEVRLETEEGEQWIMYSSVMRDRKLEPYGALQKGCLVGVHVEAWDDQDEKIRSQNCNNSSVDFETPRLWCLSWKLHPESPVGLREPPNKASWWSQLMMREILSKRGGVAIQGSRDPQAFFLSSGRIYEDSFWLPNSEEGEESVAISPLEAIVSFRDRLKAQGTELLFVIVPRKESLIPGYVTRIPYEPADGRINIPVLRFGAELSERGVPVVDLTNSFLKERFYQVEGEELFLYETGGTHWSSYGAQLAAAHVRMEMANMGFGGLLVDPEVHAERLLAPWIGDENPLDRLSQGTFSDPGNFEIRTSYHQVVEGFPRKLEDVDASVYLIGDSFTGYATQRGCSLAAHLDAHLRTPLRTISSPGQAATTVRSLWLSNQNRANAKLVVWEIAECFLGKESDWMPVRDAGAEGAVDLISEIPPSVIENGKLGEVVLNEVKSQGVRFESNQEDQRSDLGAIQWKAVKISPDLQQLTLLCGGVSWMEKKEDYWTSAAPIVEVFVDGKLLAQKRCPCFWTTFVSVDLPESLPESIDLEIKIRSQIPELLINQLLLSGIVLSP